MPNLGTGELIIILLVALVLFGGGRVGKLGGELGTAIREFRKALSSDSEKNKKDDPTTSQTTEQKQ